VVLGVAVAAAPKTTANPKEPHSYLSGEEVSPGKMYSLYPIDSLPKPDHRAGQQ